MTLEFGTLLLLDLLVAAPVVIYYYYWGVAKAENQKRAQLKNILRHVKKAYFLTGIATIYIPILLLYFLYVNILYKVPTMFWQTSVVMGILIVVFEYVNYYSFVNYEKVRLK